MKEKLHAFLMWILAAPVAAIGFDAWMHKAETLLGFLTALLGFLIGVCGLIWWIRRLKRQTIKMTLEELDLQRMLDRKKKHHATRREDE